MEIKEIQTTLIYKMKCFEVVQVAFYKLCTIIVDNFTMENDQYYLTSAVMHQI